MTLPVLIQFLLCPLVLVTLLLTTAPYGRHHRSGWGPVLPNRVAWLLMEVPAVLVIGILVLRSPAWRDPVAWVPLLFWQVHYLYRTFLFPALMRAGGRSFPVLLVLFAVGFNVLNGYNNAEALLANARAGTGLWQPHLFIGASLFLGGFFLHVNSDAIIRRLRAPQADGYGIPRGGMFRWVSSPHYLGEIIQWSGWAIMIWSLAGLAFALFTLCNLAPRALSNQRWYRSQFPDYPRRRRALIPGVF